MNKKEILAEFLKCSVDDISNEYEDELFKVGAHEYAVVEDDRDVIIEFIEDYLEFIDEGYLEDCLDDNGWRESKRDEISDFIIDYLGYTSGASDLADELVSVIEEEDCFKGKCRRNFWEESTFDEWVEDIVYSLGDEDLVDLASTYGVSYDFLVDEAVENINPFDFDDWQDWVDAECLYDNFELGELFDVDYITHKLNGYYIFKLS